MKLRWILSLVVVVLFSISAMAFWDSIPPEFLQWASVTKPSNGETKIYGIYQAGCIAGAKTLPIKGTNYEVVRTWKNRYHGHPVMIGYLTNLGKKLAAQKQKSMLIEDIGYPRGGPFYNGHASHQVGLDVDISLRLVSRPLTKKESDKWVSPTYVIDRKYLNEEWKQDQINIVSLAANFPEVNRIFVAPAIKKYFCDTTPNAPWLYKLRSWWGHDDHLHVRLTCPKGEVNCKNQSPLDSSDNGCGSDLAWWFSAEADAEWEKMQQQEEKPTQYPHMPAPCHSLPTGT